MGKAVPVQDVVAKLLTTRTCTREEFKRIYKLLCKNTHPDLTGKDGSDFIKLQEILTTAEIGGILSAAGMSVKSWVCRVEILCVTFICPALTGFLCIAGYRQKGSR